MYFNKEDTMNVVQFAKQVLEMDQRIRELECENARLREDSANYDELLSSTLRHNQNMAFGLLELGLKAR